MGAGPCTLQRDYLLKLIFSQEFIRSFFDIPNIEFIIRTIVRCAVPWHCCAAIPTIHIENLLPSPRPWHPLLTLHILWVWWLQEPDRRGVIQYLSSCDWLISLSMSSSFIHIVAYVKISFSLLKIRFKHAVSFKNATSLPRPYEFSMPATLALLREGRQKKGIHIYYFHPV